MKHMSKIAVTGLLQGRSRKQRRPNYVENLILERKDRRGQRNGRSFTGLPLT